MFHINPLYFFAFFCLIAGSLLAKPRVTILNNAGISEEEKVELVRAADFWNSTLGIEEQLSILIILNPNLPETIHGYTLFKDKINKYQGRQITIGLSSKLTYQKKLVTLAHEMVHVKQFLDGDLIKQDHQNYIWKGKFWENIDQVCYRQRPWEHEALTKATKLLKIWKKEQNFKITTQPSFISSKETVPLLD